MPFEFKINSKLLNITINSAQKAGKILKDNFLTDYKITSKTSLNDLVTEYDLKAEKIIVENILSVFPDHQILTEESDPKLSDSEYKWIIDPIDGTVNFAHKLPIFSISIALFKEDQPLIGVVFNPITDELFYAEKGKGAYLNERSIKVSNLSNYMKALLVTGFPYNSDKNPMNAIEVFGKVIRKGIPVRRLGSAALDLAFVAAGRLDGFWEVGLKPWDVAAGMLILKEAGGIITDYEGKDFTINSQSLLASNGSIHNDLLGLINGGH